MARRHGAEVVDLREVQDVDDVVLDLTDGRGVDAGDRCGRDGGVGIGRGHRAADDETSARPAERAAHVPGGDPAGRHPVDHGRLHRVGPVLPARGVDGPAAHDGRGAGERPPVDKLRREPPARSCSPKTLPVRLPMPRGGNRPPSRRIRHLPAPGATFNGSIRAFAPLAWRQPGTAVVFGGGCRPVGDLHLPGAEVDEHRRVEGEAVAGHVRARAFAGTAAVAPGGL
jgi:hypothetical protein